MPALILLKVEVEGEVLDPRPAVAVAVVEAGPAEPQQAAAAEEAVRQLH